MVLSTKSRQGYLLSNNRADTRYWWQVGILLIFCSPQPFIMPMKPYISHCSNKQHKSYYRRKYVPKIRPQPSQKLRVGVIKAMHGIVGGQCLESSSFVSRRMGSQPSHLYDIHILNQLSTLHPIHAELPAFTTWTAFESVSWLKCCVAKRKLAWDTGHFLRDYRRLLFPLFR